MQKYFFISMQYLAAVIQHFCFVPYSRRALPLSANLGVKFVIDLSNFACRAIKQKETVWELFHNLLRHLSLSPGPSFHLALPTWQRFLWNFPKAEQTHWKNAGCSAIYIFALAWSICLRAVCILVQSTTEFYSSIVFCAKNFCLHGKYAQVLAYATPTLTWTNAYGGEGSQAATVF